MGHGVANLTAAGIRSALSKPGVHSDGDGLFLKVRSDKAGNAGSAQWFVRIQFEGKRRDYGLGGSRLLSLAEARDAARVLRKAIKVERRDVLSERRGQADAMITFRQAAQIYHAENEAGWKSIVYARQWLASLENYAFVRFGDRPVGSITAADIISAVSPIWQEIPEAARQVRNRICVVLDYAHAKVTGPHRVVQLDC